MLARMTVRFAMLVLLGCAPGSSATVMTCGELKTFYKNEQCCGAPSKVITGPGPACPYDFSKPSCDVAEPQSPRDLTSGATGSLVPKAATLNAAQTARLPLVNVHFHLGAEHKAAAYSDDADAAAYDYLHGRRLATNVRPGYMCDVSALNSTQTAPYTFQYCKGQVEVGKSYEVHYVHSSAGYSTAELAGQTDIDGIDDGLGGAANGRGQRNPMITVQGQVYQIVQGAANTTDLLHSWTVTDHTDTVMYPGSTTGPSHNNAVCSPFAITWHVDKVCHQVSPEAFDNLCKQMKDIYNLDSDLYPHGSRKIVSSSYVVQPQYVIAYA